MTTKPFQTAIKKARLKKGLSLEKAAFAASMLLPEQYRCTHTTITRIEQGIIVHPEPILIAALARVYGVPLGDLDPTLPETIAAVRAHLDEVMNVTTWLHVTAA